jgi:hypothetical protein
MTKSEAIKLVREVIQEIDEANTSGAVGAYHTPFAFSKTPSKRATKAAKRQGYKKIKDI